MKIGLQRRQQVCDTILVDLPQTKRVIGGMLPVTSTPDYELAVIVINSFNPSSSLL